MPNLSVVFWIALGSTGATWLIVGQWSWRTYTAIVILCFLAYYLLPGILILLKIRSELGKFSKEELKKTFDTTHIDNSNNEELAIFDKIFIKMCNELFVPTFIVLKISHVLTNVYDEIKDKHKEDGMPYNAIIAYFAAGSCLSLVEEYKKIGDSAKAMTASSFSIKFREYGDAIGISLHCLRSELGKFNKEELEKTLDTTHVENYNEDKSVDIVKIAYYKTQTFICVLVLQYGKKAKEIFDTGAAAEFSAVLESLWKRHHSEQEPLLPLDAAFKQKYTSQNVSGAAQEAYDATKIFVENVEKKYDSSFLVTEACRSASRFIICLEVFFETQDPLSWSLRNVRGHK